jgi:uncharacterized protein (TIGR00730 family)
MENNRKLANLEMLEGPHNRFTELIFGFRVLLQFLKGFRKLHFVGPCLTIFGSARYKPGHMYYEQAREMGARVSDLGFTVLTGGGPGIMQAANQGAMEAKGKSVGINIELPFEQDGNPYLNVRVDIKYFFVRKVLLFKYSFGFIVFPGGFGTLDELFEALTLIQTQKMPWFPVVLIGKDYWKGLLLQMQDMEKGQTISPDDINLVLITDDMDEALAYVQEKVALMPRKKERFKKLWFLGE